MSKPVLSNKEFDIAISSGAGWCLFCEMFTLYGLEDQANKENCPRCHHNSVYGAQAAADALYFTVESDDWVEKPFSPIGD